MRQRGLARALRAGWQHIRDRSLHTTAAAAQQAAPQPDTIEVRAGKRSRRQPYACKGLLLHPIFADRACGGF